MSKYNGIVIADIHVGAFNLDKLHNEYLNILIHNIEKMESLDFLVIAGDFFDHKFYLNDKETTMAYIMLKELILACKEKNAVVRIVYGTESHECNQYDILSLLKIYDKIEIIKTVKDEELLPGLNVLYLPEEYIVDKDEYYHDYFSNYQKYDYVFGHGVIREVMKDRVVHMENKSKEKSKTKNPAIFTSKELSYICKGQIYFGHYHLNYEIDDKIFSISSFSRWKFGEEGRKGFYKLKCNTEKEKYSNTFVENTMADGFKTIVFGYDNDVFSSQQKMDETISSISAMIGRDIYDNVKFVFNVPKDVENPEATLAYLKDRLKYKDNVKVELVHGLIEEKKKKQKEMIKMENEKYGFIMDKNIPIEDKLSKYIKIEYQKDLPSKDIIKYMTQPVSELLE